MARNKHPEETERKILDVAFRLFSEKGYDHTTIQDIVNALGMSKGAVYHHFPSKEAILDKLYDRCYDNAGRYADFLSDPTLTGLEKLREVLRRQLSDGGKLAIDATIAPGQADPRLIHLMLTSSVRDGAPVIRKLLEEGLADGSITTRYPKELSEVAILLPNLWVGLFPATRREYQNKFRFLRDMTAAMGVPVFDDDLMSTAMAYYDHFTQQFTF